MILNSLKNFSQNVQKNKLLTNTILGKNKNFSIIFISKLSWFIIDQISSSSSKNSKDFIKAFYYLFWTIFTRTTLIENDYSRVIYPNYNYQSQK